MRRRLAAVAFCAVAAVARADDPTGRFWVRCDPVPGAVAYVFEWGPPATPRAFSQTEPICALQLHELPCTPHVVTVRAVNAQGVAGERAAPVRGIPSVSDATAPGGWRYCRRWFRCHDVTGWRRLTLLCALRPG